MATPWCASRCILPSGRRRRGGRHEEEPEAVPRVRAWSVGADSDARPDAVSARAVDRVPAWAVKVPTCTECGERFIDAATAKAWDEVLEAGLVERQRRLLAESIARLTTVRLQREWEKRLNLSPGYLSRLKAGKECSVPLTTLLALLAEAPAASWEKVAGLWSERATPPVPAPVVRLVHSQEFATHTFTQVAPVVSVSTLSPVALGPESWGMGAEAA